MHEETGSAVLGELSAKWRENGWLAPISPPRKAAVRYTYSVCRVAQADKRCGMCGWCADNARWERIFQTKFADPHYYKREAHVVLQSSLGESR